MLGAISSLSVIRILVVPLLRATLVVALLAMILVFPSAVAVLVAMGRLPLPWNWTTVCDRLVIAAWIWLLLAVRSAIRGTAMATVLLLWGVVQVRAVLWTASALFVRLWSFLAMIQLPVRQHVI